MGINFFILSLIVLSLVLTNITVQNKQVKIQYTNIPLVTFENSTLYELDEQKVTRIINSSQALNYKNRDELYDATIIVRNKSDKTDLISAEYILKKDNFYKLYQNVLINIKSDNNTTLISDYVEFDEINNIIKTNKKFDLKFNDSQLIGTNLYFDANKEIIKAHNTHFKIKLNEENK